MWDWINNARLEQRKKIVQAKPTHNTNHMAGSNAVAKAFAQCSIFALPSLLTLQFPARLNSPIFFQYSYPLWWVTTRTQELPLKLTTVFFSTEVWWSLPSHSYNVPKEALELALKNKGLYKNSSFGYNYFPSWTHFLPPFTYSFPKMSRLGRIFYSILFSLK